MLKKIFNGSYGENLIKERKRKKAKKVEYDLCYKLDNKNNNLEDMFGGQIRKYVEEVYVKNKYKIINNKEMRNLFEENIKKDLLALRILKDEIKQKISTNNYGITFISILIAMLSVVVNNLPSIDKKDIVFLNIGKIIIRISKENANIVSIIEKRLSLPISIIILLLIYILFAKWYEERLNCINYSINILEAIKEDIYFQKEKESKEDECRYRVDLLNSLNSFKENKSNDIVASKEMRENKRLALNFTKDENDKSLVNKASKISFLILFLFRMKKRMNDKK